MDIEMLLLQHERIQYEKYNTENTTQKKQHKKKQHKKCNKKRLFFYFFSYAINWCSLSLNDPDYSAVHYVH